MARYFALGPSSAPSRWELLDPRTSTILHLTGTNGRVVSWQLDPAASIHLAGLETSSRAAYLAARGFTEFQAPDWIHGTWDRTSHLLLTEHWRYEEALLARPGAVTAMIEDPAYVALPWRQRGHALVGWGNGLVSTVLPLDESCSLRRVADRALPALDYTLVELAPLVQDMPADQTNFVVADVLRLDGIDLGRVPYGERLAHSRDIAARICGAHDPPIEEPMLWEGPDKDLLRKIDRLGAIPIFQDLRGYNGPPIAPPRWFEP